MEGHFKEDWFAKECGGGPVPNFSTDMADAAKVMEKLAHLVGDFQQADGFFHLTYADSADHGDDKGCDPGETIADDDDNDLTRWSCHLHPGVPGADEESAKLFGADCKKICVRGETAAHAICLAALKLYGVRP